MKTLPRIRFAHLPTPIEPLPRLSEQLGLNIFVKRDDQTGLAFGGNKTRKLEFLVAEAKARNADRLVSTGALQSNHCRQVAAAAARFGMACTLVLVGEPPETPSANLLLDLLLGADIVWVRETSRRDAALEETVKRLREEGGNPYLVPYGGSSPTGAAGYVFAVEEFLSQGIDADWIVFPSSSGGTHAGLALGARIFGYRGKVLGISIDEPESVLRARVAALANQVSALLDPGETLKPQDILADDSYNAAGYGVLTDLERNAVKTLARLEGLLLDPVYTGRAMGGLLDLARRGFFEKGSRILFWHTGGTPGLMAARYADIVK